MPTHFVGLVIGGRSKARAKIKILSPGRFFALAGWRRFVCGEGVPPFPRLHLGVKELLQLGDDHAGFVVEFVGSQCMNEAEQVNDKRDG